MIVDPEPPDSATRRWPFLIGWSLAAGAIVGGIFFAQAQTPAQLSGPVSEPTAPAATASGSPGTEGRQVSTTSRHPQGERASFRSPPSHSVDGGVLTYLDYSGHRIAIGLHDDLVVEGAPSD